MYSGQPFLSQHDKSFSGEFSTLVFMLSGFGGRVPVVSSTCWFLSKGSGGFREGSRVYVRVCVLKLCIEESTCLDHACTFVGCYFQVFPAFREGCEYGSMSLCFRSAEGSCHCSRGVAVARPSLSKLYREAKNSSAY